MAYLNRGWYALGYLVAEIIVLFSALYWHPAASLLGSAGDFYSAGQLALGLIAVVHAIHIARTRDPSEHMRWYSRWEAVLAFFLVPLGLALFVRGWFYQAFSLPSGSMVPTLYIGDNFFVSKRAYDSEPSQRGDVIVFKSNGTSFVKRIIGLPGDRVQMINGKIHLNGTALPQQPAGKVIPQDDSDFVAEAFTETLPNGPSYRILNQFESAADNTDVFAVPLGHYFVLGDNRDNSDDSRGRIGYVAEDEIIGKVTVVWWDGPGNEFTVRDVH
jgi:signal peptidase I